MWPMTRTMKSAFAISLYMLASVPVAAQELSVDQIRANLRAQVEARSKAAPPRKERSQTAPVTRGLKINNGTGDYVGDLYQPKPMPPAAPPASFNIAFDLNSDQITPGSLQQVYKIAVAMRSPELAGHAWMILGHTDSRGNPARNLALSKRRAQSVVDALKQMDVTTTQFFAVGRGSLEPLPGVPREDGQNRRVEIKLFTE